MSAAIVRVPFNGDDVLTVEVDGKPHVILRPALERLGVDYSTQLRKLKGKSWARVGSSPTQDQYRDMVTVDTRTFMMLLATIDENRVAADVKHVVIAYQSEVADAIEQYWTGGAAINPRITETQAERAQETLSEIAKRRLAERMDYKAILNSLQAGGAVDDEYSHVQNALYRLLFGMTAAAIRTTQPQRTGIPRKRGDGFRNSTVAKDFLTEEQLLLLNNTVLATVAQLQQRCPNGASAAETLNAISLSVSILAPSKLAVAA